MNRQSDRSILVMIYKLTDQETSKYLCNIKLTLGLMAWLGHSCSWRCGILIATFWTTVPCSVSVTLRTCDHKLICNAGRETPTHRFDKMFDLWRDHVYIAIDLHAAYKELMWCHDAIFNLYLRDAVDHAMGYEIWVASLLIPIINL